MYKARLEGAEARLVDIKGDRRYFSFKIDGEARVVNNTVVFDDQWIREELAVDESQKIPKKKGIDD